MSLKTPVNTEKEIIRLKKEGKSCAEMLVALKDGGFKSASGTVLQESILRNLLGRLKRNGQLDTKKSAGVKAAKTRASNAKAKIDPIKALAKASKKDQIVQRFVTAMIRIPVEINLGTTEFRVLSLDK